MTERTPLLVADIDWDRQSPCNDCPFLKTSPFHEGVASSLGEYMDSIRAGTFAHTCHKTDNREGCDGPRNHEGRPQHCRGAVLMLVKTAHGLDLQLPLLKAGEAGKLDIFEVERQAKAAKHVFRLDEMLKFYGKELGKLCDQWTNTPEARALERKRQRRRAKKNRRR